MIELVEANWPYFLAALLIGIAVAWFIFVASRKTKIARDSAEAAQDKPATRNQALIDAEPVAKRDVPVPEVPPVGLAGAGPAVAAAAQNAQEETAAPTTDSPASGDDLTRIKGVGSKLVVLLKENGVTSFAQIADWSEAEIDAIDDKLGRFSGRIRRDDWVKQAKLLAAGDTQGYESQFGKL
ncbi:hypothetical protein [Parerythrobacter jejuensis]|uniref:Uncharacterized protein n=1 Tax=Parerythrobacter jejuensis TaxID=795812 RepID=A0A845AVY2_9SPHN|nr:hypothetical protein [Parerythrobacter jejuensis]MXP32951.1 hypothetical protein [Parerythrobacter jejuensis]